MAIIKVGDRFSFSPPNDKIDDDIYKAVDLQTQQSVCLKEVFLNEECLKYFKQEVSLMQLITSPYIVRYIYDEIVVIEGRQRGRVIMEFVPGGDLKTLLQKGAVAERTACRWIMQLLMAMKAFSSKNVVHRDIKPANILLTTGDENGDVKLCDFGISRQMVEGGVMTRDIGTLNYIAPEAKTGHTYKQGVDIWSLGVVFSDMIYGLPHSQEKTACYQSSPTKVIIDAMVEKDPANRISLSQLIVRIHHRIQEFDKETQPIEREQGMRPSYNYTVPNFCDDLHIRESLDKLHMLAGSMHDIVTGIDIAKQLIEYQYPKAAYLVLALLAYIAGKTKSFLAPSSQEYFIMDAIVRNCQKERESMKPVVSRLFQYEGLNADLSLSELFQADFHHFTTFEKILYELWKHWKNEVKSTQIELNSKIKEKPELIFDISSEESFRIIPIFEPFGSDSFLIAHYCQPEDTISIINTFRRIESECILRVCYQVQNGSNLVLMYKYADSMIGTQLNQPMPFDIARKIILESASLVSTGFAHHFLLLIYYYIPLFNSRSIDSHIKMLSFNNPSVARKYRPISERETQESMSVWNLEVFFCELLLKECFDPDAQMNSEELIRKVSNLDNRFAVSFVKRMLNINIARRISLRELIDLLANIHRNPFRQPLESQLCITSFEIDEENGSVKVLKKINLNKFPHFIERFKEKYLRQYRKIASYTRYFQRGNELLLSYEYHDGGDLGEFLSRESPCCELAVKRWMYQLLQSVKEIHRSTSFKEYLYEKHILLSHANFNADLVFSDFQLKILLESERKQLEAKRKYVPSVVAMKLGNDKLIDVWCLGRVFYLMIEGMGEADKFNSAAQKHDFKPKFKYASDTCKDLLTRMLNNETENMISIQECIDHCFFKEKWTFTELAIDRYDNCCRKPVELVNKYVIKGDRVFTKFLENNEVEAALLLSFLLRDVVRKLMLSNDSYSCSKSLETYYSLLKQYQLEITPLAKTRYEQFSDLKLDYISLSYRYCLDMISSVNRKAIFSAIQLCKMIVSSTIILPLPREPSIRFQKMIRDLSARS